MAPEGKVASKPLFRDPIYDGAADPVLCWNRAEKKWFMFYTNRRANVAGARGVTWVHGTPIGIAESSDAGATWTYRGKAEISYGGDEVSYWAPEVIEHDGTYHMYLTFVPGIFPDWGHPRDIIHLTSKDLLKWEYESTLMLSSDRVIDACVYRLPDNPWRLWYNNERDSKSIYLADSNDLYTWQNKGRVTGVGERPGEGPKVFRWKGYYWMVVDIWDGLGLYRSTDALNWERQPHDLVKEAGQGADDQVKGGHPDVVVSGNRAYLFYFTHPGRLPRVRGDTYETRRSSIQVVELQYADGTITCDRDKPTYINLLPPEENR
ncbi:MAG: family 43 glycosylhydrolase [Sedimentisphaerales bacterium]|nr:family 43 glycosylhydrolase [Sedimentisphaerales bacterium]